MQSQTILRRWRFGVAAVLLPALAQAASPAGSPAFATPGAFAATGAGLGALRVLLALALVLAAVFGAAALLRRLRLLGSGGAADLQVLGQVALGARERAVLLRAGGQQFLIGVAPGNVRLLSALAGPVTEAAAPAAAAGPSATPGAAPGVAPVLKSFREVLRRSLGR
jgi:flagellar protein FliO/FliZ